ncbi:MAG: RNA polymerase sigma factor [candidate division FCPU426 bacterium]
MPVDIESYYRKYGPMVLRRCRTLLRHEEWALDALQEVFVNLLRHQERLHDAYPSSLLYRMATRVCLNLLRTRRRKPETPDEALLLSIAHEPETENRVLAGAILDRLFARERPSTRAMLVMLYVDGLTLEEVARETGLSVSGVRKRVREFKARAQAEKEQNHG